MYCKVVYISECGSTCRNSITAVKRPEVKMDLENPMEDRETWAKSPTLQDVYLNSNTHLNVV